ncbi:MAG: DEAD/DEAH box helicase family protein [Nitrospina sp.]|jgi:DNA repair protein RadD|nr:DEAD/DEAH box helicase family protein [Nitrospina sp.]MBT3922864.1 DEAD/DEAH box helicase family protein [Nitrospina sp.]
MMQLFNYEIETGDSAPEIKLRDYQLKTIEEVEFSLVEEVKAVLVVLPTGSGKTVIAAELIRRSVDQNKRIIFLAHRRELVLQCSDKLGRFGIEHGIIMAGVKPSFIPDVQVGSIQTLSMRLSRGTIEPPKAELLIFDEGHHCNANTYLKIIARYPDVKVIGLTATPIRGDGKGLGVAK